MTIRHFIEDSMQRGKPQSIMVKSRDGRKLRLEVFQTMVTIGDFAIHSTDAGFITEQLAEYDLVEWWYGSWVGFDK